MSKNQTRNVADIKNILPRKIATKNKVAKNTKLKKQTKAELRKRIAEDYVCTCYTYTDGATDEKLFNDLFKAIRKNGLNPFVTGETLKLVLGEVLAIKHKR